MRDPTAGPPAAAAPSALRPGLPPWHPTNEAEKDWLRRWTNEQFADLDAAWEAYARTTKELVAWCPSIEADTRDELIEEAKAQARLGDLEPLRRLYPEILEFLCVPKLKPGQHRPVNNNDEYYRLRAAIDDVHIVRNIWAKNYNGRWKRPDNDPVTAESIAAGRHGLAAAKVKDAMYKRNVRGSMFESVLLTRRLLNSMKPTA